MQCTNHRTYSCTLSRIPKAQNSFSPRLTFIVFLCLEVWAFYCIYITEVRWEQLSKTTLSRVAFSRTGAEYSPDLFWKQKTFSRFRISRIIRFRCWRRGLGGERELLKWQREEKKTFYTLLWLHIRTAEKSLSVTSPPLMVLLAMSDTNRKLTSWCSQPLR